MSLVVQHDSSKSTFEPKVGLCQVAITHIVDLGPKPDKFNPGKTKHQVGIVLQTGDTYKNKEGVELPVRITEMFTLSLHEKAKLRAFIEGVIGKSLVKDGSLVSFDVESLVGKNCMVTLAKKDPDSQYSHVVASAPLMKNMTPLKIIPLDVPQWLIDFRDVKGEATPAAELLNETLCDIDVTEFLTSV